ncbi:MAG: hypothetical protein Q9170_001726 [Blastenia crenularia]
MHSHQYHSHSAPSLFISLPERQRPPVPHFPDCPSSLPQQPLGLAALDTMEDDPPWNDFDLGLSSGPGMAGPSMTREYLSDYQASALSYTPVEPASSTESQFMTPSDMHLSGPPSAALTYQSTPQTDILDSPALYSNETSPVWNETESPAVNDNLDYEHRMSTFQMFPDLPGDHKEEDFAPKPVPKKSLAMSRKVSSPGKTSPGSRPSGVTKKKKSKGPLPDIRVDENDPVALKRARNTIAARHSRQRKVDRTTELEQECILWKERAIAAGWSEENEQQELDI